MVDATRSVASVRNLRRSVVNPIEHEQWRTLVRETYPSSLDRVGPNWLKRWGREVDWTVTEVYGQACTEDLHRQVAKLDRAWRLAHSGSVHEPARVLRQSRREISDQQVHETVRKVCVIRPGVEPQTARAVIEALLVVGWTPPAQG